MSNLGGVSLVCQHPSYLFSPSYPCPPYGDRSNPCWERHDLSTKSVDKLGICCFFDQTVEFFKFVCCWLQLPLVLALALF